MWGLVEGEAGWEDEERSCRAEENAETARWDVKMRPP